MDPFGLPAGFVIPTSDEVDSLVNKAATLDHSFGVLGDQIEERIANREQEFFDDATKGVRSLPLTRGEIEGAMKAGELKAKQEARRFRDGMLKLHDGAITDQLRQLSAVNEKMQGLLRVYPSSQAYLSSQHLGDPKRTEYLRQIEHASTGEIATMARLAIATNNRALAAAVQSKLDSMPKENRPFSSAEFAERVVGQEYGRFALAAKKTSHAFQHVINRHRALQRGHDNLHERVKSGLRAKHFADNEQSDG